MFITVHEDEDFKDFEDLAEQDFSATFLLYLHLTVTLKIIFGSTELVPE